MCFQEGHLWILYQRYEGSVVLFFCGVYFTIGKGANNAK